MLINTQKRPESQSGILVIVEPGFPFARFGEDLFALRNRERGFFQMLKGECGGAMFYRTHTGVHQPLLQDANAADGALVEKLPRGHQVRLGFCKWQLLLEGEQNTAEYLPVFSRLGPVALEVQIHTTAAQLGAQITKGEQFVRSQEHVHCLGAIGNRLDDSQLISKATAGSNPSKRFRFIDEAHWS